MLDGKKVVKVTNRDNGSVGYYVPDLQVRRNFARNETKNITVEELEKLSYVPGGEYILTHCLKVDDLDVIQEILNKNLEPEYSYTEKDIDYMLTKASMDEFLDCLDFAPEGVINLLKIRAVETNLNDVSKRKAILEKTGFSVDSAVMINAETAEKEEKPTATRRVGASVTNQTENEEKGGRRTTPPVYKIKDKN